MYTICQNSDHSFSSELPSFSLVFVPASRVVSLVILVSALEIPAPRLIGFLWLHLLHLSLLTLPEVELLHALPFVMLPANKHSVEMSYFP